MNKAGLMGVDRQTMKHERLNIPEDMSLTDRQVLSEFMLEPGKRIQWEHYHIYPQLPNDDIQS
jgi:hypothetical protein